MSSMIDMKLNKYSTSYVCESCGKQRKSHSVKQKKKCLEKRKKIFGVFAAKRPASPRQLDKFAEYLSRQ